MPNLLLIGAAKCGTTSLHRYLGEHPQIHMAEAKELRFFLDPACADSLDTYASFFDGSAMVRGESTPAYSFYPLAPAVPERIHAAIPDVRLIYLVRDPVERAISHYVERRSHGSHYVEPLDEAFGNVTDPFNLYIAAGSYATQLERYLRLFSRDRILVIDQADLLCRRHETLRSVFRFLGVDDAFWSPRYAEIHDPAEGKVRWTPMGRRLTRSRTADAARSLLPPGARKALYSPVRRMTIRKVEPPVLDDAMRNRLLDVFHEEVERLRELTGKQFASWQI